MIRETAVPSACPGGNHESARRDEIRFEAAIRTFDPDPNVAAAGIRANLIVRISRAQPNSNRDRKTRENNFVGDKPRLPDMTDGNHVFGGPGSLYGDGN